MLAPGGFAAVATFCPLQPVALQWLTANQFNPSHNPSPSEMHALFDGTVFRVSDQHRVRRPTWTRLMTDFITVGVKN